ncbi:hypothetical protein OE88DRAFT_1123573 [Heliocybe sulcata]|uniref:F-box domain-containing protein n=1 Tax=Heliocybe sulcata TaxID=5364 RepID=A0A5C3N9D7_9AGAM|nr:hypothetical protein OE88DRAFT_1123573 [Heliocybe sulcata]
MVAIFESLPLELLRLIFSMSCTDGGRTVCCIRRVSKTFRDASEEYRFRSVALDNISSNRTVAAFIDSLNGAPFPRVSHLFVHFVQPVERLLIESLFETVSESLDTLYCIVGDVVHNRSEPCYVSQALWRTRFPRLTHLTFRSGPRHSTNGSELPDRYPSLRSLHVSPPTPIHFIIGHLITLNFCVGASSALTEVCLLGANFRGMRLANQIPSLKATCNSFRDQGLYISLTSPDRLLLPRSVQRYEFIPVPGYVSVGESVTKDMEGLVCSTLRAEPLRTVEEWKQEWLKMLDAHYAYV